VGEAVPKPTSPKPLRFRAGCLYWHRNTSRKSGCGTRRYTGIRSMGMARFRFGRPGQAKAGVATPQSTPSAQRPIAAEIKGRNGPANGVSGH